MSSLAGRPPPGHVFSGFRDGGIDRALQALQGGFSFNGKLLRAHDLLEALLVLEDRWSFSVEGLPLLR